MTDSLPPGIRWAPRSGRRRSARRTWFVIGIAVLVVVIALSLALGVLYGSYRPEIPPATGPIASAGASDEPSPAATETRPGIGAVTAPPPVPDPSLKDFAARVQPWLDDAATGLAMASQVGGAEAAKIMEPILQDAERLSEVLPPSSIADTWSTRVGAFGAVLNDLSRAYTSDSSVVTLEAQARRSLQQLRELIE